VPDPVLLIADVHGRAQPTQRGAISPPIRNLIVLPNDPITGAGCGESVTPTDCLIAASALASRMALLTADNDLPPIAELEPRF